jgi:hypothetical protein
MTSPEGYIPVNVFVCTKCECQFFTKAAARICDHSTPAGRWQMIPKDQWPQIPTPQKPLVERVARKLAPEMTGFVYDILLDLQQRQLQAQIRPILDACHAEEMRELLERIASYPDANPISDAHYIVRKDARALLAKIDSAAA